MKRAIEASELVLNPDGSVYHLHLHPENISNNIIIVGDQDRVQEVSKHFDRIEFKASKREFVTHTGYIGKKRFTVLSTGIGTDNIDIVFNELDALINIDLKTREIKDELQHLTIVRVGTSGSLQRDIPVDSILLSSHGLGLDGLLNFYEYGQDEKEQAILALINKKVKLPFEAKLAAGSESLIKLFSSQDVKQGITLTSTGFYGPQGRMLRLQPKLHNFIDDLAALDLNGHRITNLEMETSGIYGLGKLLGHECLSVNAILANRQSKTFSTAPHKIVEKAILMTLENLLTIA
jgi:uridine phosphorylase